WRVPCSPSRTRKSQPSSATYSIRDGSAVRMKQPKTAPPSASFAFVVFFSMCPVGPSVDAQADDVLPAPRCPRADHRRRDRRVRQRLGETRIVWLPGDHGAQEGERLDQLEVLVADRVAAARDDVPLVGERVPAEDLDE